MGKRCAAKDRSIRGQTKSLPTSSEVRDDRARPSPQIVGGDKVTIRTICASYQSGSTQEAHLAARGCR